MELVKYKEIQEQFLAVCQQANKLDILKSTQNVFEAAVVVKSLRDILTDEFMDEFIMPLMNTKVGFLTDRTGKPDKQGNVKPLYKREIVRDAVIDAISMGLSVTGNQFNIISERFYPTKEGYSFLLKKENVKYIISQTVDKSTNQATAEIDVKVDYTHNGEKGTLTFPIRTKKDSYSSSDQLYGKAERKAKKMLYEYLTGIDLGDGDENSSRPDSIIDLGNPEEELLKRIKTHIDKSTTISQLEQCKSEAIASVYRDEYIIKHISLSLNKTELTHIKSCISGIEGEDTELKAEYNRKLNSLK